MEEQQLVDLRQHRLPRGKRVCGSVWQVRYWHEITRCTHDHACVQGRLNQCNAPCLEAYRTPALS
jgi:hypothetical protein